MNKQYRVENTLTKIKSRTPISWGAMVECTKSISGESLLPEDIPNTNDRKAIKEFRNQVATMLDQLDSVIEAIEPEPEA